jgi:hypothetical protein
MDSPETFGETNERQTMKMLTYPVIALAGLILASVGQAQAGDSGSCCSSSCGKSLTAASPRLQATLDERCISKCAAPAQESQTATSAALLNGSPRIQLQNQKPNVAQGIDASVATFKSTGDDGITASPKLRSQLDERRQTVQIAPLK